jgi:pimeloyl-ACP methyl ester carboxylesterase
MNNGIQEPVAAGDGIRGGHVLAADGTRIAYLEEGSGPAILFVHGGLGQGLGWKQVCDSIAGQYRTIMMDRRAHGRSDWGGGPDLEREAADVLSVISALGPVAAVAGHSYGAAVALVAALRDRAASVPRLVLYEPPLAAGPRLWPSAIDVTSLLEAGQYEQALIRFLSASGGTSPEEVEMFRSSPIWPELVSLAPTTEPSVRTVNSLQLDSEPLGDLTIPVLLLRGSETSDPALNAAAEYLAERMPTLETAALSGQTHHALLTAPEMVANLIREFVSKA